MSDDYGLSRSYNASIRLNLQHFLWKQQLGYNLHPQIPTDSPDLKIADVATGTGSWLFEVASSLPNAHLDGFDISLDQLPSLDHTPDNVSFDILNALEEIPDRFKGRYDIVHSRMMCLVVTSGDPTPLFKNLLSMLKPGGWIQFGECDHPTMYAQRRESPKVSTVAWELYSQAYAMMMQEYPQAWTAKLDKYISAAGASDVQMSRYPINTPFAHKAWTENQLAAFQEMSYAIAPKTGVDAAAFRELIDKVSQEHPKGADIYFCPVVCIGRQP